MDSHIFLSFNNKTILVTGATGFVGGRLVELLAQHSSAKIKVLVRDYGKAMRIGRYPVEFIKGDINDADAVNKAVQYCEYVFHCAYGNKGSAESRNAVNIEGTMNVLQASHRVGVTSFVFLSTISVYGLNAAARLDEKSTSSPNTEDSYAVSKLEAERLVLQFAQTNHFHATVLQPTAVYGPWSPSYVIRPMHTLTNYKFPLINGGDGICNAVYIDDLCQAMFLAATAPASAGQKYAINGGEVVTWSAFYNALSKLVPASELVPVDEQEMKYIYKASVYKKPVYKVLLKVVSLNKEAIRELLQYPFFGKLATWAIHNLPEKVLRKIRPVKTQGSSHRAKPILPLDDYSVLIFKAKTTVDHAKAIEELNYQPAFDLKKGFAEIEKWVNWYLPQG
jgi:nucleoside-diphosphate-sugar epimerase